MKLKEISVRKGSLQRLTLKGSTGSYNSKETNAEVTMTFGLEDIGEEHNPKEVYELANVYVKKALTDLQDEDEADWLKEKQINEKE